MVRSSGKTGIFRNRGVFDYLDHIGIVLIKFALRRAARRATTTRRGQQLRTPIPKKVGWMWRRAETQFRASRYLRMRSIEKEIFQHPQ